MPTPTIKVYPKDETIRKLMKHPVGHGFDREWPYDQFTMRRIADGDVLTEDPNAAAPAAKDSAPAAAK